MYQHSTIIHCKGVGLAVVKSRCDSEKKEKKIKATLFRLCKVFEVNRVN